MSKLFSSVQIGAIPLKHRVVMAPLTRSRAGLPDGLPGDLMLDYYTQRASDGGLIISEGTPVSPSARGWLGAPGMYSVAQVAGWKRITAAVHAKGGRIFAQLWHTGRSSHVTVTEGTQPVSASVNAAYWENPNHLTSTPSGWVQPSPHRALETNEITSIVGDFRKAAENAKTAGFDGVELHGANGYLIDQFLQDGSNKRTNRYGGSIANRARLLLEIVEAVASVFGGDRVAVRIGPSGHWNGMSDRDPQALFEYVAEQLNRFGLAYLHIIEPRVAGNVVTAEGQAPIAAEHLRTIFKGPIMAAGGFEPETAEAVVEKGTADLVAFGRHFVSNPDLPTRIERGLPLAPHDRNTFYTSAVDLVVVLNTAPQHAETVRAAIAAGKNVYCEWPLTVSSAIAEELAASARAAGVRHVVGLQRRLAPHNRYLRDLLADGYVGTLRSVRMHVSMNYFQALRSSALRWTAPPENFSSVVAIYAGHFLDMLFAAIGRPTSLTALLVNQFHEVTIAGTDEVIPTTTPDQLVLSARLAGDAVLSVHVEGGKRNGSGVQIDVTGDAGDLRITNASAFGDVGDDYLIEGAHGDDLPLERISIPASYDWLPQSGLPSAVLELANLYVAFARDATKGTHDAPTFDDAVWLHHLFDSFARSSDSGERQFVA